MKADPATAIAAIATLTMVLVATPAEACWSDSYWIRRVIGVSADGGFVTTETAWNENADGVGSSISVHDRSGAAVESFRRDPGETSWSHGGEAGPPRPELVALDLDGMDLAQAGQAVAAAMKTTPLRASSVPFRHVRSGVRCGSIERKTTSGFVRIADVGEQIFLLQTCHPVTARGFEHPSSGLEFVKTRWSYDLAKRTDNPTRGEHTLEDVVTWYPKSRVEGLELALRGERALNGGKASEALPMLEQSIRLAPEYVPSRRALVWAAAQAGAPWSRLEPTLDVAIPKGTDCVAWAERDAWMDLPRKQLPWTEADSLASVDVTWPWDACREEQARFYRVNAKGESVR